MLALVTSAVNMIILLAFMFSFDLCVEKRKQPSGNFFYKSYKCEEKLLYDYWIRIFSYRNKYQEV